MTSMDRHTPPSERPPAGGSELNLRELPDVLRRRGTLFAGTLVGVVGLVMLATLLLTPVYESASSVRVRSSDGAAGGLASGMMSRLEEALPMGGMALPSMGETDVETEMGVLASRLIMETVADSLSLHVGLSRPWREYRTSVLRVLDGAGVDAPRGTYTLSLQSDGSYTASARGTREVVALPDRVVIGEPFDVGPMRFMLEPALAHDSPSRVRFQVRPFRRVVRKMRKDIKIEREAAGSRLIEVSYRHPDPYIGQAVVNRIVDDFMEYSFAMSKVDSRREVGVLTEQVADVARRLAEAEHRLQAYQEEKRIIAPEEQAEAVVGRIAELQVVHDAMEVERAALTEFLREVVSREVAEGGETPYRQLATFPSFLTNGAVQSLLQTLTHYENQRAELRARRTDENIDVRTLQSRIREIEQQLFDVTTDYLRGLDTQIASSGATLARFGSELEDLPAVELEYARLTRERRLLSEVYLLLQARLTDARVQEEIDDARARVVDVGVIEDRPAFPRPAISLVLSTMLGLMAGLFAVVVAETTNPYARSRRETEEAAGAPVIASIPSFDRRKGERRTFGRGGSGWSLGRRKADRRGLGPILRTDPWHPASESCRALALTLLAADEAPRMLVVTSPAGKEGRSAVAANLALALAEQGLRTALVDADLQSGSLAAAFDVPAQPGWPRAALGGGSFEDAVREVASDAAIEGGARTPLHLFPAGVLSAHPLGVLTSGKVRAFLEDLRERYDVVVIDAPPLEDGHAAVVLAEQSDGVILVARAGRTTREAIAEAADRLRQSRAELRGIVLNQVEPRKSGRGREKRRAG